LVAGFLRRILMNDEVTVLKQLLFSYQKFLL